MDVEDEISDEGDAAEALDPEGDVADIAPGIFARGEGERIGVSGGAHAVLVD